MRFTSVSPDPLWVVNVASNVGTLLFRKFPPGLPTFNGFDVVIDFEGQGWVTAFGFRLVPVNIPNQFVLTIDGKDGSSTTVNLPSDVTSMYVGIADPNGLLRLTISQSNHLDGTMNFGFASAARSSVEGAAAAGGAAAGGAAGGGAAGAGGAAAGGVGGAAGGGGPADAGADGPPAAGGGRGPVALWAARAALPAARAETRPTVRSSASSRFGLLDGNTVAYPTDLNDLGAVVGQLAGPQPEAFIWRPGGTIFALPGLPGATADAVNNAGEVAGLTSGWTPYLWPGGALTLPIPRPEAVEPVALNELDDVVGSVGYIVGSTIQPHAYLWRTAQQGFADLGTLGGPTSHATALNDAEKQTIGRSDIDAAGTVDHAFLWESGVMRDLVPGWQQQHSRGDQRRWPDRRQRHRLHGRAACRSLGRQWHPRPGSTLGGATSTAVGLDASGWVIGNSQTATGETHAFFWDGTTMRDLNPLGGGDVVMGRRHQRFRRN